MIRPQRISLELPSVLALGSNLGDREATIRAAVGEIAAVDGIVIRAASSLVETPALKIDGVDEQAPPYLNAVLSISTTLLPDALLDTLAGIERAHGRLRTERWGDRTLDIDIVKLGGLVRSDDRLTLPHPGAATRAFVLAPWLQIEPDAELPGLGRIDDLLAATGDEVRPYPAQPLI